MMKDKLTKHNHKFVYFVMKRFIIISSVVICVSAAITIPTYISLNSNHLTSGKAEDVSSSSTPEETSSSFIEEY